MEAVISWGHPLLHEGSPLAHLHWGCDTEGPHQKLADVNMQFMPFEQLNHLLVFLLILIKGTRKYNLLRVQVRPSEKLSLLSQGSCTSAEPLYGCWVDGRKSPLERCLKQL